MPIYRTRDFGSLSPAYQDVTGVVQAPINGLVLDPFGPRNAAFAISEGSFYRTRNLDDVYPAWGEMLAITTKISSGLVPTLNKLQATIARQNRVYVVGWRRISPSAETQEQFVIRTDDGGQTWSAVSLTGGVTSTPGYFTLGQFPGASVIGFSGGVSDPNNILRLSSNCVDAVQIPSGNYVDVDLGAAYTLAGVNAKLTSSGNFGNWSEFFTKLNLGDSWLSQVTASSFSGTCSTFPPGYPSGAAFGTPGSLRYVRYYGTTYALGNNRVIYEVGLYINSGPTPVPTDPLSALAVGQHNADKVYVSDGNAIRRSVNAGAAWSTYIAAGAYDLECPYPSNPNDNDLRYIGADGKFYTTSGNTPTERAGWGTETPAAVTGRIVTFVGNADLIYTLFHDGGDSYSVKRSLDGGATWSTRSSGYPNARAIGLWPYGNGDIVFMMTDDGPQYSIDGGTTFSDKAGDMPATANPLYIVPVWVSA